MLSRGDFTGLQRILASGAVLASGLGILVAAALLLIGPFLLHLYGPGFPRASPALAILIVGQLAQAMVGSGGGILAVAGRNRSLIIIMSAAIAVSVPLCLVLIPALGQIGAALATSAALSGSSLSLALAAWKLLRVDTTMRAGSLLLLRGLRSFTIFERGVR